MRLPLRYAQAVQDSLNEVMNAIPQSEIPATFHNIWRVGGLPGEDENAGRICKVVRYERDCHGHDLVRVVFIQRDGLFHDLEALLPPHQLFPEMDAAPAPNSTSR